MDEEVTKMTKELLLTVDPEFVYHVLRFTAVCPDVFQHLVALIPPCHMMRHMMEVLWNQVVFMKIIFNPLCQFLDFKPSVFSEVLNRNIDACTHEEEAINELSVNADFA